MSIKIVLTGGRSPAALELSRLLHAAGHTVIAAESWKRHLCGASKSVAMSCELPPPNQNPRVYAEALRSVIIDSKADVLLPTCEEIYTISKYRDMLIEHCQVFAEPISVLERLHHKGKFIEWAESLGLKVPLTRMAESREELMSLASNRGLFPGGVILKPAYSRSGSKVGVISDAALTPDIEKAVQAAAPISAAYPWVVQARLPGRQLCTYSIAQQGTLVAHTAYWTRYTAGVGSCVHFEHVWEGETFHFVEIFVKATGFTGQIAFDFKEGLDGRLLPIECNPRATSGIHLLAGVPGIDRALVAPSGLQSEGILVPPASGTASMLGAAMLLTGWRGSRTIRQWREWVLDYARARDVLFRWNDPMPAVEQLGVFGRLCVQQWRTGMSLLELTTSDIEWNGEA
ncbi:hypothetical protein [Gorillibacterium sp. sgz5001074]|uniref:hypothetical protein n=1 Tax=Gorillibacterium sp. sgz5001074 TaxID=3446695 RepID=UPI003F672866